MTEIPESLLRRSAEAKAKALGLPVEQVLAEMKGEAPPTPPPSAEPEPAGEAESAAASEETVAEEMEEAAERSEEIEEAIESVEDEPEPVEEAPVDDAADAEPEVEAETEAEVSPAPPTEAPPVEDSEQAVSPPESATEEPAAEPAAEEPAAEPAAEEPAAEPAAEEPAAVEPAAVEPAAVEPAAEEPAAEEPAAVEPAAEEPAAEPVVEEPAAEEPAAEPAAEEPAAPGEPGGTSRAEEIAAATAAEPAAASVATAVEDRPAPEGDGAGNGKVAALVSPRPTVPPKGTPEGVRSQRLLTVVKARAIQAVKAEPTDKVNTWPHLMLMEFGALLAITGFLVILSVIIHSPLLDPANFNATPNPSKAPWYFLGLQELLSYFDPQIAGVMIPTVTGIIGFFLVPYVDKNPSTRPSDRKFAIALYSVFLAGAATLTIFGVLFRGLGFNFSYPWQDGVFFDDLKDWVQFE